MKTETIIRNLEEVLRCPKLTTEQCFALACAIDKLKKKIHKKTVSGQTSSGEGGPEYIQSQEERTEGK